MQDYKNGTGQDSQMVETFCINGRPIGSTNSPYIVAEMSANHNGELDRAIKLIEAAKNAGADAVKIQTYTPDTITIDHDGPEFLLNEGIWSGQSLYQLYQKAYTPWEWHSPLFNYARKIGITLFSAPFDPTALDLLQSLESPAYKIASPEITDIPLIKLCAATKKPIIISTGMASLAEIEEAVVAAKSAGATQILVLHCVSGYPTPLDQANLSTINDLAKKFDLPIGLSDHTIDTFSTAIAIGQGAVLIEKHFTLARGDGSIDNEFSLEPHELKRLVNEARAAYSALGRPNYQPTVAELQMLGIRRSLYVVQNVKEGEVFSHHNIRSIRPSGGLPPKFLYSVLGKSAARNLARGEPLAVDMVSDLKI